MASTATSTPLSLSSSSALINAKAKAPSSRPESASAPPATHLVTCPSLPPVSGSAVVQSHAHHAKPTAAYHRNIGRNVVVSATGEVAPAAAAADMATIETPEIVKTIREAWNKVEDKYAVSSLAVAGGVALCTCWGAISAIDKLPLIPGVLELVGLGYSGWFAYRNLIFKPDRDALICKIKETYKEIIGSS